MIKSTFGLTREPFYRNDPALLAQHVGADTKLTQMPTLCCPNHVRRKANASKGPLHLRLGQSDIGRWVNPGSAPTPCL